MRFLTKVAVVATVLAAACAKVEKVELTPAKVQLSKNGETASVAAAAFDQNNQLMEGQKFTYTTSDDKVATVDEKGTVTAVKSGTATIEAKVGEKAGSATVEVQIPAKLSFAASEVALTGIGAATDLAVTVLDDAGKAIAGAQPNFAVADGAVAALSGKTVTAVALGTTKVTATFGSLSADATLNVVAPAFAALAVEPAGPSTLKVGETLLLTVAAKADDGAAVSGVSIAFATTNDKVATVDAKGLITAVGAGNADVNVVSGDKTTTVKVTVKK